MEAKHMENTVPLPSASHQDQVALSKPVRPDAAHLGLGHARQQESKIVLFQNHSQN